MFCLGNSYFFYDMKTMLLLLNMIWPVSIMTGADSDDKFYCHDDDGFCDIITRY